MRSKRPTLALAVWACLMAPLRADTLDAIRQRGQLIWGGDAEGGGPYVFPKPEDPEQVVGFEVELADALAAELGVKARFRQCLWDDLPAFLRAGQIDVVLNGFELTPQRAALMAHTHPYYVYQLILLGPRGKSSLSDWQDLRRLNAGKRWRIGVLRSSAAHHYLEKKYGDMVDVRVYEGNTDAMREVETGKLDGTIVDLPVAIHYRDRFSRLRRLGEPVGRGYYVIFLRSQDSRLRDELNAALLRLLRNGRLEAIYRRYGLWSPLQESLEATAMSGSTLVRAETVSSWEVVRSRGPLLVKAAGMTVLLALASMPLAIVIGLFVALGRVYGPAPLRWVLTAYVEVLRGTPLMLQLFFIYFMLPELGLPLTALEAAISGLAINYSAYEAEIYRAGLQAIPRGQMEAALALGMSQALALRRVIVPQAVRIVIPPVTNDFIALFKDTSVCSVISVVELTNQYRIQQNSTGATLELAGLTALLYLVMSLPLAHLAGRLEKRLRKNK